MVYVYGMSALGRSLVEVCFRPERAAAILGRSVEDPRKILLEIKDCLFENLFHIQNSVIRFISTMYR